MNDSKAQCSLILKYWKYFPREFQIRRTNECDLTNVFIRFVSLAGNMSCTFNSDSMCFYVLSFNTDLKKIYSVRITSSKFNSCLVREQSGGTVVNFFVIFVTKKIKYSLLSLSRPRLSRITAYLEEKTWSLFKHRNVTSGNKILWIRGEIAPQKLLLRSNFSPFPQYFKSICLTKGV